MRGFVALLRREFRDARWHLVGSAVLGAVVPFVLHGWMMDGASAWSMAQAGGRWFVPILFALFTTATGSDLVARDVATRRIDALAVLPVPGSVVWAAKFTLLLVSSLVFLVWLSAAEWVAIEATRATPGSGLFVGELLDAIPSLLGGLALGTASLFLSTLIERGMSAALGAIVLIVTIAVGIHWAELPAAPGATTTIAAYAVPLGVAIAFAAASRWAFVRGPVHGPSKVRVAAVGLAAFAAVAVPGGAAVAFALDRSADLAPGEGDASRRAAFLSQDKKWVAVEDSTPGGASRTWLIGVDDASCRPIADGSSWLVAGGWLPGGMLCVVRSTFSAVAGPRFARRLEVEPTHLTVAEDVWIREPGDLSRGWESPHGTAPLADGRAVRFDGDVTLVARDGATIRRLFPPETAGGKGK